MLNSHCNNNDTHNKISKKNHAVSWIEPTMNGLKDHRPTHYATEFGAKNRLLYA